MTFYRYVAVLPLAALAACSGGAPSASNIQRAIQAAEDRGPLKTEITKVQDVVCNEADAGRYRCSFKVTVKNGSWVRNREGSRLFEKRASGWASVGQ